MRQFGSVMLVASLLVVGCKNSAQVSDDDFKPGKYPPLTAQQEARALDAMEAYTDFNFAIYQVGSASRNQATVVDVDALMDSCTVDLAPLKPVMGQNGSGHLNLSGAQCPAAFSAKTTIEGNRRQDAASYEQKAASVLGPITKLVLSHNWERDSSMVKYAETTEGTFSLPSEGEVRFVRKFRFGQNGTSTDEKVLVFFQDFTAEIIAQAQLNSMSDLSANKLVFLLNGEAREKSDLFEAAHRMSVLMSGAYVQ